MAAGAILSGQYDDGLSTYFSVDVGTSPNHIQHAGGTTSTTGVRLETGASSLCQVAFILSNYFDNKSGRMSRRAFYLTKRLIYLLTLLVLILVSFIANRTNIPDPKEIQATI